ncbi:MAG: LytTR family DNA-binding domain-containing protein [Bacteroidota bacterium]
MTAIIVEDQDRARQALQKELTDHCPEVELIGHAGSVVEAAKLLRQTQPDVLLLDIMLGDGTGFDLLEIFPQLSAKVIFVTASEEFALRAFRFAAVDYLLKPIDGRQLAEAIARAQSASIADHSDSLNLLSEAIRAPDSLPERISLHTQDKILVTPIKEIIRCESDSNNTRFFLDGGQSEFVTKTLKHYERLLVDHHFMRVHQSHLVNLRWVQEFQKRDGGFLLMRNGDSVPVASRKRAEVVDILS